MTAHSFTLLLGERDVSDDRLVDIADALYEAGCDDALVGVSEGRLYAAFTRRADTMDQAVASATADVEAAGAIVVGVDASEDDE